MDRLIAPAVFTVIGLQMSSQDLNISRIPRRFHVLGVVGQDAATTGGCLPPTAEHLW